MKKLKSLAKRISKFFRSKKKHFSAFVMIPALICSVLLCSGCGGTTEQSGGNTPSDGQGNTDTNKRPDNALGDYVIDIISYRIEKNYDESPVLLIKYAFTNNSDEAASFDWTIEDHVYQNGIELTDAIVVGIEGYESTLSYAEIKTGVRLEFEKAYVLRDSTSQVTVELNELISFGDDVITKTIDLA